MIALLTALQTAFNANTYLSTTFANGLENGEGANVEVLPNCLLIEIATANHYATSTRSFVEDSHIQFTIRSTDAGQVRTALDQLQATFDHQPLALVGDVCIDSRVAGRARVWRDDERVWRGDVDYNFLVCRVLGS